MHPLKGAARWVIFPILSIAAGGLAGLAGDLSGGTLELPVMSMFGSVFAGASAAGVVITSNRWLGGIVAGIFGLLGVSHLVASLTGWTVKAVFVDTPLSFLQKPGLLLLIFMGTSGVVALHWHRMSLPRWPLAWLLYAAAGTLTGLVFGALSWPRLEALILMTSCDLGVLGALEIALRMSRRAER